MLPLCSVSVFNKGDTEANMSGPPFVFIGKSQGTGKIDYDRVAKAEESKSYMSA